MNRLSRRQFVTGTSVAGLGLLAGCGRLPGQASTPEKMPRVGIVAAAPAPGPGTLSDFREGLRDHGYIDGQNIAIEYRSSQGRRDKIDESMAEFIRLPVDIIIAPGQINIIAAKQATDSVPIIMAGVDDPVGGGFIASLARPGGNVTGLSFYAAPLGAKRLELLKQAVPAANRVAVLGDSTTRREYLANEAAARVLGVQLEFLEVPGPDDLESVLDLAFARAAEAILVHATIATTVYLPRIAQLTAARRLPAMAESALFVQAGGLMAYGPNYPDVWRRAAYYVDRILKGAKPADLPVEQPMIFDFVVNMKTARELGITFPNEIMLQVTEVIE